MATVATAPRATVLTSFQDPLETGKVYFQSGGYRLSRPVLTGDDAKPTFDTIPTVDVSQIFSPDANVRKSIAAKIASVCENVGFFYAANPPVSHERMDAAMSIIKKFFRLPQENLLDLHVDNSQGLKGYLPFEFQDGSRCRASYSLGRDYTNPEQHFVKRAADDTVSINQFPDKWLPEFRTIIYEYYRDVFDFSRQLLKIFALALGLEENDLDTTFRFPLNDITMQYYPVQKPNDQSSIVPHADYGGFTLLFQDDVGGLEVLNANGIWVPAPPKQHTYVVNTGSYMEVLSNGRFPATVHRAFGNAKCERFSLPFFFNPDPDAIVAPHPQLLNATGGKALYAPQDISRRQIKALLSNRPLHPFFQQLREMGFDDDEITFDLITKSVDEIEKSRQGR